MTVVIPVGGPAPLRSDLVPVMSHVQLYIVATAAVLEPLNHPSCLHVVREWGMW